MTTTTKNIGGLFNCELPAIEQKSMKDVLTRPTWKDRKPKPSRTVKRERKG